MKAYSIVFLASFTLAGCVTTPEVPLKSDPYWVSAELDNGMKYHIYPDREEPVSVRLVMHVGSLQENNQQLGYAHFVEHMAFNGSKNFSQNDVIKLFEKGGASFGADINAYTSYEETVYKLDLVDNNQLEEALLWMRDIGDGMTMDAKEVSKEAEVIQGEFRLTRLQEKPIGFQFYDHMIQGTPYEARDPLGSREIVNAASNSDLRAFYQAWYLPQYAEVVVAGDVTLQQATELIESTFGDWQPGPVTEKEKLGVLELSKADFVGHVTKAESPSIGIMIDRGQRRWDTREDMYRYWLDDVSQRLIYERLTNDFTNAALPQNGTLSIPFDFDKRRYSYSQVAFPEKYRESNQKQFFDSLASLRDYGVDEQALANVMKEYQKRLNNVQFDREKLTGLDHANGKVLAISLGQVVQSELDHKASLAEFIAKVDLAYMNRHINELLSSSYLIAAGVSKDIPLKDVENQFLTLKQQFDKTGIKPLAKLASGAFVTPNLTGKVIEQSQYREDPPMTKWVLSNGVEVLYLNDVYAGDDVRIVYSSQGGKESLSRDLFAASEIAVPVVTRSGMGEFSGAELFEHLNKHSIQIFPFINFTQHGVEIHTDKEGLTESLAALHTLSTDINVDEAQLKAVKEEFIRNRDAYIESPFGQFITQFNHASYEEDSSHWLIDGQAVERVTQSQIRDVHQQLFSNNINFNLVIVGNLPTAQLTPLLKTYVASIPLTEVEPVRFDAKYRVKPKERINVALNTENSTEYIYRTIAVQSEPKTAKTVFMDDMLRRVIQTRLEKYVREALSLDYAPYSYAVEQDGEPTTDWFIGGKVAPKNAMKIEQAIDEVVQQLRQGISEEETQTVAKQFIADLKPIAKDQGQHAWFLSRYSVHEYGTEALFDIEGTTASITAEDLSLRAKQVFSENNRVIRSIFSPK